MAGKKKKTLANKLAKMSDEERARYMQHRADIEEEAKRRKEQLISTFMKKKIKREEAFTRLNIAKINQNWHQIMRKSKCKQMRENIEHLKKWMEDRMKNKNEKIERLMRDLEKAEEVYLTNFNSHSTHIDDILDNQNRYVEKLKLEYQNDLEELLNCNKREKEMIMDNTDREEDHLKTIVYGQETQAKEIIRSEYQGYMQMCYETECEFQTRLDNLGKTREDVSDAIWKQIAATVGRYVTQTDVRRAHLAELKRLDADSAAEIAENEERIRKEELLIEDLKEEYSSIKSSEDTQIQYLQLETAILTKQFLKIRRNLQTDLKTDEEQIKMLSDVSCKTIQYLESVAQKGQRILSLGQTCKKFETEREKIIKWMPLSNEYLVSPVEGLQVSSSEKTRKDSLKDTVEPMDPLQPRSPELKATRLTKSTLKSKERPKTTIPKSISSPSIPLETPTPELQKITTIQNITLQTRTSDDSSSSSSSATTEQVDDAEEKPKSLLDRCFVSLQGLEGFWFTCNKVQVDYLEVQEEKRVLAKENKQLRGTIRAVLEAAAMSNSIPNSRVSTRLPSRRSAYSAPFRRMVLD